MCLASLLIAVAFAARGEQSDGGLTLGVLTPVVGVASEVGGWLIARLHAAVLAAASAVIVLVVIAAARARDMTGMVSQGASVVAIIALAMAAQIAFLWNAVLIGMVLIAGAIATGLLMRKSDTVSVQDRFEWVDVAVLMALTASATVLRFYALNQLPNVFEGELAPYYLAATNLQGIPLGNAGVDGPWAPLGFLFYVPVFLSTKFFGSTVLAVRFSSAAVSLITLTLLYVFALIAFGRAAAVFASTFFVLDPLQIGWARTDVHPHAATTWLTIIICLITLVAFRSARLRWFAVLAVLMAVSWHQYPSGQTAALIPPLVLGASLVRGEKIAHLGRHSALLAFGLLAWIAGAVLAFLPLGRVASPALYFQLLDTRVLWNSTEAAPSLAARLAAVVRNAWALAGDLIAGLFVRLRYTFHQDIFVPIEGWPSRSVSWIVGALVLAGACQFVTRRRRRDADWMLVAWIIAAVLPALFSDRAYPKRAATLFPALFVLAGAVASECVVVMNVRRDTIRRTSLGLAALAAGAWFCATSYLWFSSGALSYGRPNEEIVAERVAARLIPGTIVIADVWHGYAPGKLTYVLRDALHDRLRQPLLWYPLDSSHDLRDVMESPERSIRYANANAFYYRWGDLSPLVLRAPAQHEWKQVIFVLQTGLDSPDRLRVVRADSPLKSSDVERLELLRHFYPGCPIDVVPAVRCDDCGFLIAACPLAR